MARQIKNECFNGGGQMTVSCAEANRGEIKCSGCGKWLKIRANRDNVVNIPRHSSDKKEAK